MPSRFKVLLVATNVEEKPFPVHPIGASLVAGALEEAGIEVLGVDLFLEDDPVRAVAEAIAGFDPDLVAFSIRAVDNVAMLDLRYYLPASAEVVRAAREATDAPMVIGGGGYSLFPKEILEWFGAEFGIQGEGERLVVRLVRDLVSGEEPAPGEGLFVLRDGEAVGGPQRPSAISSAWTWPRPSYRQFPLQEYIRAGGTASVQTKRGCPQKCCYCTYPLLEGRVFRLREPPDVRREIESLRADGVEDFYFVDNTFNLPGAHAEAVCGELAHLGGRIRWTCLVAPQGLGPRLAAAMVEAGCRSAEVGSEAASDVTLRAMGKGHDALAVVRTDRLLREAGITPAHFFIFGGPEETWETIERSLELMDGLGGVMVGTIGMRVYPGTPLQERARRESPGVAWESLVEPAFYVSPATEPARLFERLAAFAASHPRFLLLGSSLNVNETALRMLRRKGKRGPLWEFYSMAR